MLIRRDSPERRASVPSIPGLEDPFCLHVLAPAKVNLYLEVLGRRPDGYHSIETLMLGIGLFDELSFEANHTGDVTLSCDRVELSAGPDNLVSKAAALLKAKTGCAQGAQIRLKKRIPWSAGLGGGSSDAAAALTGLNELWNLGLAAPQLAEWGAELGSDVPFFFHGRAALCTGRGEIVEPVGMGKPLSLVLVKPPQGISTAAVYQECDRLPAASGPEDPQRMRAALEDGDVETVAACLHNRLQEPAFSICPPVARLHRRLQASGAAGCLMTGSGSCLFALCRDDGEARQVVEHLSGGWPPGDELHGSRVFYVQSCR